MWRMTLSLRRSPDLKLRSALRYSEKCGARAARRYKSDSSTAESEKTMKAWEVHSYDGPGAMKLNQSAPLPPLGKSDVLVQIKASSVNPLDVMMSKGYGHDIFHLLRHYERGEGLSTSPDFPYIPGRDFAGIVAETGSDVTKFKKGDEVYGVLNFGPNGSHAEYTKTHESLILRKPDHLSFLDAACFPFVGLTCWSALRLSGMIINFHSNKILILGASGGVGVFAVQYCLAQKAEVFGSCEPEAIQTLERLGLKESNILDYTKPESAEKMKANGPYDILFDCSGVKPAADAAMKHLKTVMGRYISLNPPNLPNVDNHGVVVGALKTGTDFAASNIKTLLTDKVTTRWGYFVPSPGGLRAIGKHIQNKKIQPVIGVKYPFAEMKEAYERCGKGRIIGKLVVEH